MITFKVELEKAIAVVLYISSKLLAEGDPKIKADFHKIFKILYFADKKHILEYGRPIVGDNYIAMKDGPVPSKIYEILKIVRGDSIFSDKPGFSDFFDVNGYYVHPKQEPDLDELSESEIACLELSIQENKRLPFGQLRDKSHGAAYEKVAKDERISFTNIAKEAGASNGTISYMRSFAENSML